MRGRALRWVITATFAAANVAAITAGCTASARRDVAPMGAPLPPARVAATAGTAVDAIVTKGSRSGEFEVAPYRGLRADDPRLATALREIAAAGPRAIEKVRDATGLEVRAGRGPLVVLDDGADVAPEGVVDVRLVDGVRRPVLRVSAAAVAASRFRAEDHVHPLVAEAAILTAAGEREPPDWVRLGVPVALAGETDRLVRERALGGTEVSLDETSLFASPRLAATARARALARIALGERPFLRFLEAILAGRGEEAALDAVGVDDVTFLDAAAGTEQARAARALADDPLWTALQRARAAVADGAFDRADSALSGWVARLTGPGPDAWAAADARLVLAEVALARNEPLAAASLLDEALSQPATLIRLPEARLARARAALLAGDEAGGGRRIAAWIRDFPHDARASDPLRALLGLSPEEIGDLLATDPARRTRLARGLGQAAGRRAGPALHALAQDADAGVRAAAVAGLARRK